MCNDGEIRAVDLVLSRYLRSVIINLRTFGYEIFLQNLALCYHVVDGNEPDSTIKNRQIIKNGA
jgi:hypothetical protein